jgi:chromosome segregation ATPase
VLIDKETGQPMTQGRFSQIMTKQYDKSRRSAYREMAEAAGIPYDPENFDPQNFAQLLKDAQAARQAQLTEEQRRTEELERQKQALQADRARIEQQQAELAESRRALAREQALTRLGALDVVDDQGNVTAPNLQDALAMLERDLRANPDADAAALTAAAEALKKRRPELFGAAAAPQTLPPAPSGGPAGGNAPRQPAAGKDAIREAARERARRMNLRTDDAA